MTGKKNEKKGCFIPLAFIAAGITCICIGLGYDIHILYVLGFLIPSYSGTLYNQYIGKDKKWSTRKHIFFSSILLLTSITVCLILYGKLW